ncbi:MAG: TonB-dependent receptor [Saprospiraceae bacterium]|nr:TonB-dependent receptor [Saprospiraceae bacterium]
MKNLLIGIFLIFAPNLFAQYNISGIIKDEVTGEFLIGASIYFPDLKSGTVTNSEGKYQMKNLRNGNYLFEVSYVGYKSIIQSIQIQKDTILNFQLLEAHKELTEVVVTGVTRSTELKLSPIIIKSMDKTMLNQGSASNLIDALKNIPGVSQITTGAAISKPIIRGMGYNRVITLNNGIRQEGQQWGDEHGIEMDEYSIDKVEIVKGPGSLMYGSDGIAGVLNFIAPKAPVNGVIKSQLLTNYQTNNNLIGYSLSNIGNKNGIQWVGRLSNKLVCNYQNPLDGKVYNSGFKEYDGSLMLGINKNWGHTHLTISSYNTLINLVEGERDSLGKFTFLDALGNTKTASDADLSSYKTGFPHQEIQHFRVASNNYFILDKGTFQADLAFQQNKRKEFGDITNPNDIALYFDLKTFNYNFRYNFQKVNGWETTIGLGGMYQTNRNSGLEFLIPAYQLWDIGGFLFTQKTFDKLTIASGIRWDNRSIHSEALNLDSLGLPSQNTNAPNIQKFKSLAQNYNGISGSIGGSYQINAQSTLKANISRGFRAPNLSELASNGRHEGTFRYEIGNANLHSEISHQLDIAYFYNSDHLSFEITPFVNFISNYIFTEKLKNQAGFDSIPDPSDPAPGFQFTKGNATLLGTEFYLDFHPHPFDWLHLENSFSFVQATQNNQTDSTRYLPFIPAAKYRGEIKTEFGKVNSWISNAYFKIGVDYFFNQKQVFSAYETETSTPAYSLWSAGFGANFSVFKRKDAFSCYVSGENLANTAYQSHLSRLKYAPQNPATGRVGVFNMGRNISLKLVLNF